MVNKPEFQSSNLGLSPRMGEYDLLFNVHIVNLLLKKQWGEIQNASIDWSSLVFSRSVEGAWGESLI